MTYAKGWIPDVPDQRDHFYVAPAPIVAALPASVDLRAGCPPVYDQGQLGSCTGNAIAGAIEFERIRQGLPNFVPSRLFIYYNERVIEGTVGSDAGAMIRDGIKSVATAGACSEDLWPYDIAKFMVQPGPVCYQAGKLDLAVRYERVIRQLDQFKSCLAAGFAFVFGFSVYDSFESQAVAQTGQAPMPAPSEKMLDGHAVMAVGYDDATGRMLVRNSWGAGWGMSGYFTLPYGYFTDPNLSDDFWTIRLIGS